MPSHPIAAPRPVNTWDQVLEILRERVQAQAFATWLRPTRQVGVEGTCVLVSAPGSHFAEWIQKAYGAEIVAAFSSIGRTGYSYRFTFAGDVGGRAPGHVAPAPTAVAGAGGNGGRPSATFRISSGLIDPKHVNRIGTALWLFLWCIDRQTGPHGLIFGGRPVTLAEIAEALPYSHRQIARQLAQLEEHGYITAKRRPSGLILRVNVQKKFGPKR